MIAVARAVVHLDGEQIKRKMTQTKTSALNSMFLWFVFFFLNSMEYSLLIHAFIIQQKYVD